MTVICSGWTVVSVSEVSVSEPVSEVPVSEPVSCLLLVKLVSELELELILRSGLVSTVLAAPAGSAGGVWVVVLGGVSDSVSVFEEEEESRSLAGAGEGLERDIGVEVVRERAMDWPEWRLIGSERAGNGLARVETDWDCTSFDAA